MQLSNNELLEYLSGYVRLEEKDGYIFPKRVTEKQNEIISSRSFFPRQESTSSMFIEFTTDADKISFDYFVCPGSSKEYYSIDVLENGINTFNFHNETVNEKGHLFIELENTGEKLVTIYLSNLAGVGIKNFNVSGNIKKHKRTLKMLALGDSITQGYTTKHPYYTYVNMVAKDLDAYVLNQAIGGDKFFDGNLDEDLNFDPDFITVAYGTNDWAHNMDVKLNAFNYFKKLRHIYPGKMIFALLPIFRGGIKGDIRNGYSLDDIRQQIKTAAELNNITVINCKDFIQHHEDCFWDKTLHPNELGFVFYAQGLLKELEKHLL